MKSKKFSFCGKMIFLTTGEWMIIVLLSICCLQFTREKIVISERLQLSVAFFCIGFILLFALLLIFAIRSVRRYISVCQSFQNSEIQEEWMESVGTLVPGLGEALRLSERRLDRRNSIELSTKQAEFLALQNQINPHFLYNTLDAIRGDALCIGAEALADTTEALSTFFRYTITNVGNLVTVEEELDNVDNYFRIQRYRFGDKMNLRVCFRGDEEKLKKVYCPKLSIQPIVENAIFHGLENKSGEGEVCINLEVIGEKLHIDIVDDGNGMPAEQLMRLNDELTGMFLNKEQEGKSGQKGGIALKNVCRRIKLLFGEEFGLYINSVPGIGTRVEMTLPVSFKNGER